MSDKGACRHRHRSKPRRRPWIAIAPGELRGRTVYVTGRSEKAGRPSPAARHHHETAPGSHGGGREGGSPCAATQASGCPRLEALIAQVHRSSRARIDILVNNACGHLRRAESAPGHFGKKPLKLVGPDGCRAALRLRRHLARRAPDGAAARRSGLILFTSASGAVHYVFGPAYGAHKAGMGKFAADMAVDFKDFGVAAISIWMGALLTDPLMKAIIAADSGEVRLSGRDQIETPEFTGHLIWGAVQRSQADGALRPVP